jgi:hypothetical protein
LSVLSAAVTCGFSAAYANADIERYLLVPLFVAFMFVGLGLADGLGLLVWLVDSAREKLLPMAPAAGDPGAEADQPAGEPVSEPGADSVSPMPGFVYGAWSRRTLIVAEIAVAVVLVAASVVVVPGRQSLPGIDPGGISESDQTYRQTWLLGILGPPAQGGLPADAVVVSWWSDSTTLWYGQIVEGLRPDVFVVDDRTRLDDNLGNVWDVVDLYLGRRPVFLDRLSGGVDGMDAMARLYNLKEFTLPDGSQIAQVISKKGTP